MTKCVACEGSRPEWTYETVTVGADTFTVCQGCADEYAGPGRGEGISEDDRALAAVLEHLAGISAEDHWLSDEWNGYAGVFDRYILIRDGQGFLEVRTFPSHERAMDEVNGFEGDGMGALEEDAYINYSNRGLEVSFAGKFEGTYPRLTRAMAKVSLLMRESGYYPNVWLTGEHGPTIRRIEVW